MEPILVLVTAPGAEKAAELGRALVEARLAACANVIPAVRSIYRWENKVCDEPEALLMIKTHRRCFEALKERVLALHPYQCPEVIAVPIELGHAAYLEWIASSLS